MIIDTEIAVLDGNRNTLKLKTTAKLKDKKTAIASTRKTREEWPLLTVETEVNGDSKSTDVRSINSPKIIMQKLLIQKYAFQ